MIKKIGCTSSTHDFFDLKQIFLFDPIVLDIFPTDFPNSFATFLNENESLVRLQRHIAVLYHHNTTHQIVEGSSRFMLLSFFQINRFVWRNIFAVLATVVSGSRLSGEFSHIIDSDLRVFVLLLRGLHVPTHVMLSFAFRRLLQYI